jgi:hypothetical protein
VREPGFDKRSCFPATHSSFPTLLWQRDVLCLAVPEQPSFASIGSPRNDYILWMNAGVDGEQRRDTREESLLLFGCPSRAERDLHDNYILSALDIQVGRVVDQMVGLVLGDDLKTIALGHAETLGQRTLESIVG